MVDASKKLRLNPTIIDLIFWRSYFQMRARNRAQTLQNATKIGFLAEVVPRDVMRMLPRNFASIQRLLI